MRTRKRFTTRVARAAAAFAVLGLAAVPAALANSDEEMGRIIREETAKAVAEIREKAAELRAERRWPRAGDLTARSLPCDEQVATRPFLRFGDTADYTPLPGGDFEQGARGWTLENEARVVRSSPLLGGGARALRLPKGSKAESNAVCITAIHPTIRFFAAATGSPGSRLRVEVLYEDMSGSVKTQTIGWLRPTRAWSPTEIVPITVNVRAAVAQSGTTAVAFRFSVEGDDGTWLVDDIWVDPFKSI